MLNREEALRLLREHGAILDGHFLLTSGRHSGVYVEKFRLLERPDLTARFAEPIAEHFRDANIEIVVGPLTGGVLLAHEVGKALGTPIAFPERYHDRMEWRRGFELKEGQRVLVVEDVITTGKTIAEVQSAIAKTGAEIVGIGCMICRGKIDMEPRPFAVVSMNLASFPEDRCPLCRKRIPLEKRGSREKERKREERRVPHDETPPDKLPTDMEEAKGEE